MAALLPRSLRAEVPAKTIRLRGISPQPAELAGRGAPGEGYPLPGKPAVGSDETDARLCAPTHPHRDGSDGSDARASAFPPAGASGVEGACVCKVPGTTSLLDMGGAATRVRGAGVPARASESACRDFDASMRSARKLRRRKFARSSASRRPSRSSYPIDTRREAQQPVA
jgi:hypothetical protein